MFAPRFSLCERLIIPGLMVVAAAFIAPVTLAEEAPLPLNEWVQLESGSLGEREGAALIYVPQLKRFLIATGKQTRFDRQPTPPYSEMTFNFQQRTWENHLPSGGEKWGAATGPVHAPAFPENGDGLNVDVEGNLRLNTRSGYGTMVYHLFAYDQDRQKMLYGVDREYDPRDRLWRKLEIQGHPGQASLPPWDLNSLAVEPQWSQMCYDPINREFMLFGGAKVVTETGSPGTWLFDPRTNQWSKPDLGSAALNAFHREALHLQQQALGLVATCRNRYYATELAENRSRPLAELCVTSISADALPNLAQRLLVGGAKSDEYETGQCQRASAALTAASERYRDLVKGTDAAVNAQTIALAEEMARLIRRAAISLSAEPPSRCYSPMVFDPVSQKIVLFGGYALDRSLADTWIYDPQTRRWEERLPEISPAPRLGHGLVYLPKSKKVVLIGGLRAVPGLGCNSFSGQTLPPEAWAYDVAANRWSLIKAWEQQPDNAGDNPFPAPGNAPQHFAADENDVVLTIAGRMHAVPATYACRLDATATDEAATRERGAAPDAEHFAGGQCLPSWWEDQAPPPDRAAVEAELAALPKNRWVRRGAGGLHRLSYAYSSIAFDPDRDEILCWAGGHGTYHGTDVTRYSLATDRWHTDYPAQLPLTFRYFATSGHYAYGFRPWMGVHPWGGYAYDPVLKKLVLLTSCVTFTHVFDPDRGDHERPWTILPPSGGRWNTKACSTSQGVCAWTGGRGEPNLLWRLDAQKQAWVQLPIEGERLTEPEIDFSGLTYDSKRNRLVLLSERFAGDVFTYDLAEGNLLRHEPRNKELAPRLMREFEYVPTADLVLDMMGICWNPGSNEWQRLKIDASELSRSRRNRDGVEPQSASTSQGLAYDPKRDLLWAVDGYGADNGVFVLRLDPTSER